MLGLPAPAAFVLAGLAAGMLLPHRPHVQLTPETLALFLPALIFEAAWEIDDRALGRTALAILTLAVPGVIVTAGVIGAVVARLSPGIGLVAALALGAVLAATDPVAVVALFRRLDVPLDLRTIVEGESIANDAVAAVTVQAIVAVALGGAASYGPAIATAMAVSLVGIAAGVVVALCATPLLRRYPDPWFGIGLTVAIAYGSYALASVLHASGIFASAAAGVALRSFALEKRERRAIETFWTGTASVANAAVFLLIGLTIDLGRVLHEPVLVLATVAAVVAARALLAYVVPLRRARGVAPAWRHAIALAGIRGGLSIALALGLPATFPGRAALIDAVFAVVLLTIVVQGWTIGPSMRRLHLTPTVKGV